MYIRKEHNPNTYGLVIFVCYISMDAPYVSVDSSPKKRGFLSSSSPEGRCTPLPLALLLLPPRRGEHDQHGDAPCPPELLGLGQTFRKLREAG